MNQNQTEKIKKLIATSPLLSAVERVEWNALLELMNDKQVLELEKILSGGADSAQKTQAAVSQSQQSPVAPKPFSMAPKPAAPINFPVFKPLQRPPQQITEKFLQNQPVAANRPVSSLGPKTPAFSHIMNLPPQQVTSGKLQVTSGQLQQTKQGGFLRKIKQALAQKDLPSDGVELELMAPRQVTSDPFDKLRAGKLQVTSNKLEVTRGEQKLVIPKVESGKQETVRPADFQPLAKSEMPKAVVPPVVPKPLPPVPKPPQFASQQNNRPLAPLGVEKKEVPKPSPENKVPIAPSQAEKNMDAAKAPLEIQKPAAVKEPSQDERSLVQNIAHQTLFINKPVISGDTASGLQIGKGDSAFTPKIYQKPLMDKSVDKPAAEAPPKDPKLIVPDPKPVKKEPEDFKVIKKEVEPRPLLATKVVEAGTSGASFGLFKGVGDITASDITPSQKTSLTELGPDPDAPHLRPGNIKLDRLDLVSKLLTDDFERAGGGGLAQALRGLIKINGLHEVLFNLEKSELYKNYIDTGTQILSSGGSFEEQEGLPYMNKDRFEEFADMLREIRGAS